MQSLIRDYPELTQALARERRRLGFSQLAFDDRVGLAEGHTAKIEAGYRGLGPMTLPYILSALGCVLILAPVRSVRSAQRGSGPAEQMRLPMDLTTRRETLAAAKPARTRTRRKEASK